MRHFLVIFLALFLSLPTRADEPLPTEVVINGVEFVYIPAGWFWFGFNPMEVPEELIPPGEKDPWFREVRAWQDDFYIAKYEARARHFRQFMEEAAVQHRAEYAAGDGETLGCGVRRDDQGEYYLVNPEKDLPATHLSWNLAKEFAEWMGFRLPTEAEWVRAARGNDRRLYPWGNEHPDDTYAGFDHPASCNSTEVTAFRKGVSPFGVYNMAGNVYEYVEDWYNVEHDMSLRDGVRNPVSNVKGTTTKLEPEPRKILKGGRWASDAEGLNIPHRALQPADKGFICYGVRFAIDSEKVRALLAAGKAKVIRP